jgi:hypothetical protein
LGDGVKALVVGRMRSQPVALCRRAAAFGAGHIGGEALLVFQYADHINHVARIKGVARQVFGTQRIGLQLLVAPVGCDIARSHGLRHLPGHLSGAADAPGLQDRPQHTGSKNPQARVLLAGSALRAVTGGHVANFMTYHPGQVGLAVHVSHDPAGHIDIATR